MTEIKQQFIQVKTKSNFESRLKAGDIKDTSIAFIEDSDQIWAKGKYYSAIPKEGHEQQILTWKASGEAKWEDLISAFPDLKELLYYGVQFDTTIADPHLIRIGNMSFHKTLPIQSQLRGCIAQGGKIIYWLNESDWRFRKDPIYVTGTFSKSKTDFLISLPEANNLKYINLWIRIEGTISALILSVRDSNVYVIKPDIDLGDFPEGEEIPVQIELGAILNGYDGTVRVYCPEFYIKSIVEGSICKVYISTFKIDNTYTRQPAVLIDAYRSTVLNTVPENMGYLSTLPINSAISVVNTNAYCRGGENRSESDQYLATDLFRTDLGKPRTKLSRVTMRTYSRNAGSEMLSYDLYKNIFYWLYVIEYANFNCQEAYNEALTNEGCKQGGLGAGVTTILPNHFGHYNNWNPLTPCGYCNELGNGTGLKTMTIVTPTDFSGPTTLTYNFSVPRWRGFDNPFGDINTNLDGIIIQGDAAENQFTVYTTTDPNNYGDNESAKNAMEIAGHETNQNGYTKEFDLGEAAHIIPKSVGGDATKYKCDNHYPGSTDASLRTLLVGGVASGGALAGLGALYSNIGVSEISINAGFRSVSDFVSFPSDK